MKPTRFAFCLLVVLPLFSYAVARGCRTMVRLAVPPVAIAGRGR